MAKAYLGLGTNLGDRLDNLETAIQLLNKHPKIDITAKSSIYITKPFGYIDQPDFLNMVVEISTILSPEDILDVIKEVEAILGRTREIHWGPRIIDIDILLYDDKIINSENLVIPHPYITKRLFVLIPLSEIYNGSIPGIFLTIEQLIEELDSEKGDVKKW